MCSVNDIKTPCNNSTGTERNYDIACLLNYFDFDQFWLKRNLKSSIILIIGSAAFSASALKI